MKKLILSAAALMLAVATWAQTKADIFNTEVPITFLGLDFSAARFIGTAASWGSAGEVTNNSMREKYIPAWADLFIKEKEKFKVADAVNRSSVTYAMDITEAANKKLTGKDFFSDKMEDYPSLDESKVAGIVKKYSFGSNSGIGLLLIVEGMRKGAEKGDPSYATVWVTFVNMKTKTVLLTAKEQAKAGGFGFRNFWAGAWKNTLDAIDSDWKSWKKKS
ncbi:hypothetical protein ACTHGU_09850 [Chitinophagaceae bacterium MMS25-I14]